MAAAGDNLKYDAKNANKGSVRGRGMLERSLSQYGAGRAPVASADGVILAGNKTVEVARELGIPIREVESDGRTLFVIRRTDLPYDDPRARELALADNRVGQVSLTWDADVLAALADDGVDLGQFWFEPELDQLLSSGEVPDFDPAAEWQGMPEYEQPNATGKYRVVVHLADDAALEGFEAAIGQRIPRDRWAVWFPQQERADNRRNAYVAIEDTDAA